TATTATISSCSTAIQRSYDPTIAPLPRRAARSPTGQGIRWNRDARSATLGFEGGGGVAQVRVYNLGYDPETGIGELLHTTTVRHACGMFRREVADPVELTMLGDRIVPTVLELTRELSGAWVEGAGRRSVGFSYRPAHERDHCTCAYCGRSVSRTPAHGPPGRR